MGGYKTNGTNAVTYTGMASVTHQTLIRTTTAAAPLASTLIPVGVGSNNITTNAMIPPIIPEYFFESIILIVFNLNQTYEFKRWGLFK
ncbi:hypothetical protein [Lutibacter sp.]|uniref:hypothetical protein n=1 Tax=Lutibacter sp. TaxID=1925666 RepID=UPI002736C430|nr:hypothetical protein [Lutibacter sp.]MDP3313130.1 hypothetical protein [Lutibacter sp.]